MYIYRILHKDIMVELNREYHKCAKYYENRHGLGYQELFVNYEFFCKTYNFRELKNYSHYTSGHSRNIHVGYKLPLKYFYSSGMSYAGGYR